MNKKQSYVYHTLNDVLYTGTDPGFQVRGAHLKKLRRAEGGAIFLGVFRVKNHIFSNFRGGVRRVRPPPPPPPIGSASDIQIYLFNYTEYYLEHWLNI